MLQQQYCLRWKYHHSNLQMMFSQLLDRGCFCDVTLACEGQLIRAHRVVLCACSTFFDTVLSNYANERDPIIIMKDVSFAEVKCLIEFMYKGEINVEHANLASLLKTADDLKIKGLAEVSWRGDDDDGPPLPMAAAELHSPTTTRHMTHMAESYAAAQHELLQQRQQQLHHQHHQHNSHLHQQQQQHQQRRSPSTERDRRSPVSEHAATLGLAGLPTLTPMPHDTSPPVDLYLGPKRKRGRPPLDDAYDVFNVRKLAQYAAAANMDAEQRAYLESARHYSEEQLHNQQQQQQAAPQTHSANNIEELTPTAATGAAYQQQQQKSQTPPQHEPQRPAKQRLRAQRAAAAAECETADREPNPDWHNSKTEPPAVECKQEEPNANANVESVAGPKEEPKNCVDKQEEDVDMGEAAVTPPPPPPAATVAAAAATTTTAAVPSPPPPPPPPSTALKKYEKRQREQSPNAVTITATTAASSVASTAATTGTATTTTTASTHERKEKHGKLRHMRRSHGERQNEQNDKPKSTNPEVAITKVKTVAAINEDAINAMQEHDDEEPKMSANNSALPQPVEDMEHEQQQHASKQRSLSPATPPPPPPPLPPATTALTHASSGYGKYPSTSDGGGGYLINEHGMLMTHDFVQTAGAQGVAIPTSTAAAAVAAAAAAAVAAVATANGGSAVGLGGGEHPLDYADIKLEDFDAADLRLTSEEMSQWQDVIKMDDYLAKGRRPQFWEEPFTKRVLDAIKNKRLEMKKAARILGVSYGTLYGRYREVYGCLKHPYSGTNTFRNATSAAAAAAVAAVGSQLSVQPRFDLTSFRNASSVLSVPLELGKIRTKDLSELWTRPQT